MSNLLLSLAAAAAAVFFLKDPLSVAAQDAAKAESNKSANAKPSKDGGEAAPVAIIGDATKTVQNRVKIKGVDVPYNVTFGTQPVFDEKNQPVASVFFTYYQRTDITDKSTRPLMISFNGGPGSASVWMHIAYTGPHILHIDSEGFPVQPYGTDENPHSILDAADIVYVDPVNTGFSRILNDAKREQFFGVNEDVQYLARWIDTFVSRQQRWTSPKYLIGESYGTTRVAGLAQRLQSSHWMYLNGVILVSPTNLGIEREGPAGRALYLPYYAATAWYHKALAPELQQKDLDAILPEVETFTVEQLVPALVRGGSLPAEQRAAIAKKIAWYSGLSESAVLSQNLAVPTSFFWKELLRDKQFTIGRLDSRYRGLDRADAGMSPDFDPALTSWNHAFAPAINYYLREVLQYKTDLQYWLFGPVGSWNREGDRTGENLRQAMSENPFLHIMVQAGYYDGGTDYFNAKYSMWNMDPGGRLQNRMTFKGYRSGHMMYLRRGDLETANQDIRDFIMKSTPKAGQPAKR